MTQRLGNKSSQCQSTVTVSDLGREGDGLGREGDTMWIVPGALPGDVVSITKKTARGRFLVAAETELLTPSPERVASFCGELRCGGCALREWSPAAALAWKQAQVEKAVGIAGEVVTGAGVGYRHRVRLHARGNDVGYFMPGSHRTVSINSCPVLLPAFETRLFALVKLLRRIGTLYGEIEAVWGGGKLVIEATLDKKTDAEALKSAWKQGFIDGFLEVGGRRHGDPTVVLDNGLFLEAGVFSQANVGLNQALVAAVAAGVPDGARVLELHAGVGNLTLGYADKIAGGTISEWDEQAIMCLRRNLESHGHKKLRVLHAGDVEALREVAGIDTVVLDPPRTGAEKAVRLIAEAANVKHVVYVSCDPGSLARDGQILAQRYKLESALPIDMFPGTPHVETVTVWRDAQPGG